MKIEKYIPNLFTQGNLFCGFLGIINVLAGDITLGAILIFVGAGFDVLDGMMARLLKVQSATGKELDSLADIVTFGVLPAMIAHTLLIKSHSDFTTSLFVGNVPFLSLTAFFIVAAAAYRLAKFNISSDQSTHFKGLPSPAAAIFFGSLPLILKYDLLLIDQQTIYLSGFILNPLFLFSSIFLISLLMISKIPLFAFKFSGFSFSKYGLQIGFLILSVILFVILSFAAIPVIILLYLISSLIFKRKFNEVQSTH